MLKIEVEPVAIAHTEMSSNKYETTRNVLESRQMKLLRYALAILLPPVGVFLTYGISTTLLLNILLTLLGWVPGSIHAVWAVSKHEEKYAHVSEPTQY